LDGEQPKESPVCPKCKSMVVITWLEAFGQCYGCTNPFCDYWGEEDFGVDKGNDRNPVTDILKSEQEGTK
jgi:hypothetical protein